MRPIVLKLLPLSALVLLLVSIGNDATYAGLHPQSLSQDSPRSPEQLLADFEKGWDVSMWEKTFRNQTYMRRTGEPGWKLRVMTLRSLVLQGQESVPALTAALDSDHSPTRVLAAQALSYLAPGADISRLQKTVAEDKDPAARLYAVDALGMSGKGEEQNWEKLATAQFNRDVKMHMNYASDRGNNAISDDVIATMKAWQPSLLDSAKVGEEAPDFRLKTIDGKDVALSDYRGKQPVVLVFIYGDT